MSKISVIIPACDGLDMTTQCLKHLGAYASDTIEQVIYVDNNSPPGVAFEVGDYAAMWKLPLITIWNDENLGFTKAINQGLDRCPTGHVLLLNNDCFVGPGCIQKMIDYLELGELAAVSPLTGDDGILSLRDPGYREVVEMESEPADYSDVEAIAAHLARPRNGMVCQFARRIPFFCTLLNRMAIDQIGLLDDGPGYESGLGADFHWCRAAVHAGWKLGVCLDAYAHHLRGETFRRLGMDRAELARIAATRFEETAP